MVWGAFKEQAFTRSAPPVSEPPEKASSLGIAHCWVHAEHRANLWIAELSAADGEGRRALHDGRELTSRAVRENLIESGDNGTEAIARAFAQALEDGWLLCDYERWPNDSEIPPRHRFRQHNLQRCRNIRITRSGWQSIPALREPLTAKSFGPPSSRPATQSKSMDWTAPGFDDT